MIMDIFNLIFKKYYNNMTNYKKLNKDIFYRSQMKILLDICQKILSSKLNNYKKKYN